MMRGGTVMHHEKIAGRVFAAELPAQICSECNEALVGQDALEAFGHLAAKTLADSGEVTGETFRAMRIALGMNGRAVADELGVPPETISRWERGDRPVDRFAWLVLAAIVRDAVDGTDQTRAQLRALRDPPKVAKTIRLDVHGPKRAARPWPRRRRRDQ
jgi:transcriptional regulator with XRE-family HTH domain